MPKAGNHFPEPDGRVSRKDAKDREDAKNYQKLSLQNHGTQLPWSNLLDLSSF